MRTGARDVNDAFPLPVPYKAQAPRPHVHCTVYPEGLKCCTMPVTWIDTKAAFDKAIAECDAGKLVVVDFTAQWCGPCQMISPKFEAMSSEFTDVLFLKVDVDENDETAEAYNIQEMPTFIFFRGGKKLTDLAGANEAKLRELIQKHK